MTGVAFDLDGCIIESRRAILPSLHLAMAALDLPVMTDDDLEWLIGPPLDVGFAELLVRLGRDPEEMPALLAAYRADYSTTMLANTTLMPGMGDLLRTLDVPACVVTSKPKAFAQPILEHLGVLDHLRFVEGPPLTGSEEPKRVTLERALARLPLTTMVGDRLHDVEAGRAHGLRTVGVTWGIGDAEELRGAGADVVVDTPEELLEVLSA